MTHRTDDVPRHRYSVSVKATERQLRLCGFTLLNHWLAVHRVLADSLELQPVELRILVATTTGNVQRALSPATRKAGLPAREPLPPGLVVPMSRRAIAGVTGIPKETVRHHVASMIGRRILLSTPKGVRAPNRLEESKSLAPSSSSWNCTPRAPSSWRHCRTRSRDPSHLRPGTERVSPAASDPGWVTGPPHLTHERLGSPAG